MPALSESRNTKVGCSRRDRHSNIISACRLLLIMLVGRSWGPAGGVTGQKPGQKPGKKPGFLMLVPAR
jgi:hypothetical protein